MEPTTSYSSFCSSILLGYELYKIQNKVWSCVTGIMKRIWLPDILMNASITILAKFSSALDAVGGT